VNRFGFYVGLSGICLAPVARHVHSARLIINWALDVERWSLNVCSFLDVFDYEHEHPPSVAAATFGVASEQKQK
jgi:hypothetical protein